VIECDFCGSPFDPISTRWRCTWCGGKANCCDGAALQPASVNEEVDARGVLRALADQTDA